VAARIAVVVDSMAAVEAVDPIPVEVAALTVEAAVRTVAVDITNPALFWFSLGPLPSFRSGLFRLNSCFSCPFRNVAQTSHNSPPLLVLNIMTQEV
jgi:hypothetical protein